MNKYLKYLLMACGVVGLLLLAVVGWLVWSMDAGSEQAKIDAVELSAYCDTVRYVTEQPVIRFSGFSADEVDQVHFQLLSAGEPTRDTVIAVVDGDTQVPYQRFLKTDTIVVTVQNQLRYHISGYHHRAYLHYGMFGYLGSHDCRLADECIVNGQRSYGILQKSAGQEI